MGLIYDLPYAEHVHCPARVAVVAFVLTGLVDISRKCRTGGHVRALVIQWLL